MKKKITILLTFVILIGLVISSSLWFLANLKPVSNEYRDVYFIVPKGASASSISSLLYQIGLIRNKIAFKFYIQLTGRSKNINAGEFKLSPSFSIPEIISKLEGPPYEIWVTIPEGLRKEEIPAKFVKALGMTATEAEDFRSSFLEKSFGLEGFLYPDTYLFRRDVSVENMVEKMKNNFEDKVVSLDLKENQYPADLSFNNIVTVASLLERETKSASEKPVVAGIIYKRLKSGWPLQIDAAVQYAVTTSKLKSGIQIEKYWPSLTRDDLDINSPYNTYKFKGLPPTPISNPGYYSLKAAFYPEKSDYWFYIHDNSGQIHYAKTVEEHNSNVRGYLGK